MSRNVLAGAVAGWLSLVFGGAATAQGGRGCGLDSAAALDRAAADIHAADSDSAAAILRDAYMRDSSCPPLATASWSWHAWLAAARAVLAGGTSEALAAVRVGLDVLEPGGKATDADAAYAAAVVHAAAAAAQHERDEMRVWLEHAEAMSLRIAPGARPWPMTLALAEGELMLAVDDYELAEAAFARALAGGESPAALRGLARARARRGDTTGACASFSRALELVELERPSGPLALEARAFLRRCP